MLRDSVPTLELSVMSCAKIPEVTHLCHSTSTSKLRGKRDYGQHSQHEISWEKVYNTCNNGQIHLEDIVVKYFGSLSDSLIDVARNASASEVPTSDILSTPRAFPVLDVEPMVNSNKRLRLGAESPRCIVF